MCYYYYYFGYLLQSSALQLDITETKYSSVGLSQTPILTKVNVSLAVFSLNLFFFSSRNYFFPLSNALYYYFFFSRNLFWFDFPFLTSNLEASQH